MPAPEAIHELVAKFEQHRKEYQTHKNETELRREFLDPFFEALGWDVFNKKSYFERFKEVPHKQLASVKTLSRSMVKGRIQDCGREGVNHGLLHQFVFTGNI